MNGYPDRDVMQHNIEAISTGGGGSSLSDQSSATGLICSCARCIWLRIMLSGCF